MMFVIVALAGLFQLPPRLSLYCATAGEHAISINKIKMQHRLDRELLLLILFVSCFEFGYIHVIIAKQMDEGPLMLHNSRD